MRIVIRLLAFSIGMTLGLLAVLAVPEIPPLDAVTVQSEFALFERPAPEEKTVNVAYLGWDNKDYPKLRFLIHNGLDKPITYVGKPDPFPDIRTNGAEVEYYACGSLSMPFVLDPGQTIVVEVFASWFKDAPLDGDFTVGYWMGVLGSEESKYYSTAPFKLPKEIKRELKNSKW